MRLFFAAFAVVCASALAHAECIPSLDAALGAGSVTASDAASSGTVARARARTGLTCGRDGPLAFEAAYEIYGLAASGPAKETGTLPKLRSADPAFKISENGDYLAAQNLDRLAVTYIKDGWRVTAGRQAIGHGSGRFFNPGDIFAPLNPGMVWSEYKAGVDAVTVAGPLGETLDAGLMAADHGDGLEKSYYLLRMRKIFPGFADLSAYGGSTLGAPTAALDFAFDFLDAGFYFDSVARFDREPASTLRATAGAHYRIAEDLDFLGELHFSGPGAEKKSGYPLTALTPEALNGELFVSGRYYAVLGLSYGLTPLVTLDAKALVNANDSSALFMGTFSWSVTEKISFDFGFSAGRGPGGSEFSGAPGIVFAETRINL